MRDNKISKEVDILEGVDVIVNDEEVSVKSQGKEIKMKFKLGEIKITKEGNKIKIISEKYNRMKAKLIGTIIAHLKNMMAGMKKEFEYKLEICNVHFPMTVKVEADKLNIKNFLGENIDRKANIVKNAKVVVKGNEIVVSSFDKEAVGQTVANIEKATKIKFRDRRVFQDGIYLVDKCGEKI